MAGFVSNNLDSLRAGLPTDLRRLLQSFASTAAPIWLIGGCVRDALLGRPQSGDWDLCGAVCAQHIASGLAAGGAEVLHHDPRLGAVSARLQGGTMVTYTRFRREGDYRDRRHPEWVQFTDQPQQDAQRRDFTVNAVYFEPLHGQLLDPCAGMADLQQRRLAVIGEAASRLQEDPLRLLRAVRFAAALGLRPDAAGRSAIRSVAREAQAISAERTFAELTAAITADGREHVLGLLLEWDLAPTVLPEIVPLPGVPQPPEFHPEGDVFVHVCLVLQMVQAGDPVQAWAAVLHDVGKPATFEQAADRIRFSGHDVLSAEMAEVALQRLHAPRELRETVVEVCRDHIRFASLPLMGRTKRERWMRSPRFSAHLEFHRADCLGSHGKLEIYEQALRWWRELPPVPEPPLCRGADVLALGVPAGPMVGELLARLAAELEVDEVADRDDALRRLARLVDEVKGSC